MRRFLRALGRFLGRLFRPFRYYHVPYSNVPTPPRPTAEELSKDLDLDLTEAGEPAEPLPDAEISEEERREAVRRYRRELEEKGQR
jgi:hypothetical protein